MEKAQILAELTANGQVSSFRSTPSWQKAFDAYNAAHPSNRKRMGCGSCYRDVLAWLKQS